MPEAAPVPANPMKWPEPMLLAKSEAPTRIQCMEREARKYPPTLSRFDLHDACRVEGGVRNHCNFSSLVRRPTQRPTNSTKTK